MICRATLAKNMGTSKDGCAEVLKMLLVIKLNAYILHVTERVEKCRNLCRMNCKWDLI